MARKSSWVVGGVITAVIFVGGHRVSADECNVPPSTHTVSTHTYPWIAFAQSLQSLRDGMATCTGDYKTCKDSIMRRLGGRVPEIASAVARLASKQYGGGWDGSACSPATTINIETPKSITFYCDSEINGCLQMIDGSIAIMNAAESFEPCVDQAIEAARFAAQDAERTTMCEKKAADDAAAAEKQAQANKEKEEKNAKAKADKDKLDEKRADKQAADKQAAEAKAVADAEAAETKRVMLAERWQQEKATADQANAQYASQLSGMMAGMAGLAGGNAPRGTGSYLHLGFGMATMIVPLYVDSTGSDIANNSHGGTAVGLGLHVELAYTPWHSARFSLGAFGRAGVGTTAMAGGGGFVHEESFGLEGTLGPENANSLLWRAGYGYRGASTSYNSGGGIIDAYDSGSGDLSYRRLVVGWHHCLGHERSDGRFCEHAIELTLGTDLVDAAESAPKIFGLGWSMRRLINVAGEISFGYPRAGTPSYGNSGTAPGMLDHEPEGFMMGFTLSYNYDRFGAPHRGTSTAEVLMDRLVAETARRYHEFPTCAPGDRSRGLVAAFNGDCLPPKGAVSFGFAKGQTGTAYTFDGSHDFMATPIKLGDAARYTIAAWISTAAYDGVFLSRGKRWDGWTIGIEEDSHALTARVAGIGTLTGAPIPKNTWTHVALVVDGGTAALYVNGQQVDTGHGNDEDARCAATGSSCKSTRRHLDDPDSPMIIGGSNAEATTGPTYFEGTLDDIKVFDRALDAAAINALAAGAALHLEDPTPWIGTWSRNATVLSIRRVKNEVWATESAESTVLRSIGTVQGGVLHMKWQSDEHPDRSRDFGTYAFPEPSGNTLRYIGAGDGEQQEEGVQFTRVSGTTDDALFADPSLFRRPAP